MRKSMILTIFLGAGVQSASMEAIASPGTALSGVAVALVEQASIALAAGQVGQPACCSLNVGDRVRLLVGNPYDAPNLPAGWCGVVICCDLDWPNPDQLLVSWDNWTEGLNDDGFCDQQPPAYTPDSGWWVACDQVVADDTCQPQAVCGNGACEPGEDWMTCPADCEQCCQLNPGDRVRLAVDIVTDTEILAAGACGFVVCCDPTDPSLPMFVSWDNWQGGDNSSDFCQGTPLSYPANSGYWVGCTDLVKDNTCAAGACGNGTCEAGEDSNTCPADCVANCCQLKPGDAVSLAQVGTLYDPPGLAVGACGIVVCCDLEWPDPDALFVSWQGLTKGKNDDGVCNGQPWPYEPDSGWWVSCDQLVKISTCPGCGDGVCTAPEDGTNCPEDCDLCPNDPNKTDPGVCGCGVADTDGDNDGTADCNDLCPADPGKIDPGVCGCGTADVDANNNGTMDCKEGGGGGGGGGGRPRPTDTDEDGVADTEDNCLGLANADQADADVDGLGDACDPCTTGGETDLDGDALCGELDNCPEAANPDQTDADSDGVGDACDPCATGGETDTDADGVCGDADNCPEVANPDQLDSVGDGVGDACRPDTEPPPDDSGQPRPSLPCARGTAEMMPFALLGLFLMRTGRRRGAS